MADNVTNSAGKILVFGSGVGDELFTRNYPLIFGISTKASQYSQPALSKLSTLGAKNVSIVYATVKIFFLFIFFFKTKKNFPLRLHLHKMFVMVHLISYPLQI